MQPSDIVVLLLLLTGGILSIVTKKLTIAAGITAVLVGVLVYKGAEFSGLAELCAFFVLATLATAHGKKQKATMVRRMAHEEQRTTGQVLANGGIPALLGLAAIIMPAQQALAGIMIAGALSAATADTLASELGMIYGRISVNILTFKREPRGLDGVVSIEGFLLGIGGSLAIGILYAISYQSPVTILVIVIAGTSGNIADSYLGATLERRGLLTNNMVNMANTLTGALTALFATILIS